MYHRDEIGYLGFVYRHCAFERKRFVTKEGRAWHRALAGDTYSGTVTAYCYYLLPSYRHLST